MRKSKGLGTLERLADLFAVVLLLTVLVAMFDLPNWIKADDGVVLRTSVRPTTPVKRPVGFVGKP